MPLKAFRRNNESTPLPTIVLREPPKPDLNKCCCTNRHEPWLLDGRWVVSTSLSCVVHSFCEEKYFAKTMMEG